MIYDNCIFELEDLIPDEKKRQLFHDQEKTLDTLLAHGAISKAQHDKSLRDMFMKMCEGDK